MERERQEKVSLMYINSLRIQVTLTLPIRTGLFGLHGQTHHVD